MLIEIKAWLDDRIIHTIEADSIRAAIEELAKKGANLEGSDLRGAYLRGANLRGANLRGANLRGADLRDANLGSSNLWDANLRGADLRDAYLEGSNLGDANLRGVDLEGSYLRDAYLSGANLEGANLRGASLGDLSFITELSDAIDLAPLLWAEWQEKGIDAAKKRFGLYKIFGENRALVAMCPGLVGGYCFVLSCREIWWWQWSCPCPETVPILWREPLSRTPSVSAGAR